MTPEVHYWTKIPCMNQLLHRNHVWSFLFRNRFVGQNGGLQTFTAGFTNVFWLYAVNLCHPDKSTLLCPATRRHYLSLFCCYMSVDNTYAFARQSVRQEAGPTGGTTTNAYLSAADKQRSSLFVEDSKWLPQCVEVSTSLFYHKKICFWNNVALQLLHIPAV